METEKRWKRRYEAQRRIADDQAETIAQLRAELAKMEQSRDDQQELIDSAEEARTLFLQEIAAAKEKKAECDKLLQELRQMESAMEQSVGKGRWNRMKLLQKLHK